MANTADATQPHANRPLVAGNWKMNGLKSALHEAITVRDHLAGQTVPISADVMICPPATLLMVMSELTSESDLLLGAQDCHWEEKGAHTGDISAEMHANAGASAVIVGHSERREDHQETDRIVMVKASAAHRAGLNAIICVGETNGQRQAGLTLKIISRQLRGSLPEGSGPDNTVIAYEPVWAIGTGKTPTVDDIAEVHATIRNDLIELMGDSGKKIRILYGGSVKPENAHEILPVENVDGALVGGASLKATDFLNILAVYHVHQT